MGGFGKCITRLYENTSASIITYFFTPLHRSRVYTRKMRRIPDSSGRKSWSSGILVAEAVLDLVPHRYCVLTRGGLFS